VKKILMAGAAIAGAALCAWLVRAWLPEPPRGAYSAKVPEGEAWKTTP
jgi:hypothetical protein